MLHSLMDPHSMPLNVKNLLTISKISCPLVVVSNVSTSSNSSFKSSRGLIYLPYNASCGCEVLSVDSSKAILFWGDSLKSEITCCEISFAQFFSILSYHSALRCRPLSSLSCGTIHPQTIRRNSGGSALSLLHPRHTVVWISRLGRPFSEQIFVFSVRHLNFPSLFVVIYQDWRQVSRILACEHLPTKRIYFYVSLNGAEVCWAL